jgi:predicted metal-dependent HD superfamily phosphohydrolase
MVNQRTIVKEAAQFVKELLENNLTEDHRYHDLSHTFRVREEGLKLAQQSNCSEEELEILELACLFHDTGFSKVYEGHEACSKQIAEAFLNKHSYPPEQLNQVLALIEATYPMKRPSNKLEEIIKDADLSNLGDVTFFQHLSNLRHEWSVFLNLNYQDTDWLKMNYKFINNHEFYTAAAVEAYEQQWKVNKKALKALRDEADPKKKKKKEKKKEAPPESPPARISSNKSAQTMFKTALRNHLDLAALADNKANIMLSVNALIITIVIPLAASYISGGRGYLLAPVSILLITSLASMIFATLATRPIRMKGETEPEQIKKGNSNLFFFGNFYKMQFDDYKAGMLEVLAEDTKLDDSVMRDLFYLGISLGRKYFQLRLCYNLFMWGIITAVVAFLIAYAQSH